MKTLELKLTRIGNSKGIRLPVEIINRYAFSASLAAEAREDGLLLKASREGKLSWEETAREMAASDEDWSEWDSTAGDGLEICPWKSRTPRALSLERSIRSLGRAAKFPFATDALQSEPR